MKPSIYDFTQANLVDWIIENGEKKFRATQIWEWLYRSRVQSFAEMTNLPKSLIEKDRKSTRLNSSHSAKSRMPSSA